MPVFVLFVYSRSGIIFNQSSTAITDHSQSEKDKTSILSPSSMWRTPATESRHSLYRIGWVNPGNERTTEIYFCRGLGLNPQRRDRQFSVLPLHHNRSKLFSQIINYILIKYKEPVQLLKKWILSIVNCAYKVCVCVYVCVYVYTLMLVFIFNVVHFL